MKYASTLIISAAAASLLTACLFQGEDGSARSATVKMEIKASATATTALAKTGGLILGDSTGVRIDLAEAKLVVSRIKLQTETDDDACDSLDTLKKEGDSAKESEKEKECEEEAKFALKGPFVIDLLTGTSTPDLGTMTVPADTYRKVKIEMHHGENDSTLGGRTLVASGTLTLPGGAPKPFNLSLTLNENLKIESKHGLILDGSTLHTVVVQLLAGGWLGGLDFAACLAGADTSAAVIEINETSGMGKCLDAEHRIKDNFRKSFEADEKEEKDGKDSTGHDDKVK